MEYARRPETAIASDQRMYRWIWLFPGFVVGAIIYWIVAAWPLVALELSLELPGLFLLHPVTAIMLAMVAGASVFVGTHFPIVGFGAGVFILAIVLYAFVSGVGPLLAESAWDVPRMIGFSNRSGIPVIIGTVFVCSSISGSKKRRNMGS